MHLNKYRLRAFAFLSCTMSVSCGNFTGVNSVVELSRLCDSIME